MMSGGGQWVGSVDSSLTAAVIRYCIDSPVDGTLLFFLEFLCKVVSLFCLGSMVTINERKFDLYLFVICASGVGDESFI